MKNLRIIIIGVLLLSLTACEQHHLFTIRLQHLDSLANEDPARADTLLNTLLPTMEDHTTPLHAGRGWGEGLLLLRIKVDDKLYRPITQYRDTILHLVNYFEKETHSLLLFNVSTFQRLNLSSAYLYAGRVFSDLGDAPQALDYYQRALDALPETPSANSGYSTRRLFKQRGLLHSFMGELFYHQSLYEDARECFKQALIWSELAQDTLDMIFNYRDLAEEYKYLNQNDTSLLLYQKALTLAQVIHNKRMCNEVQEQIARLFVNMGDFDKARIYIFPSFHDIDSIFITPTYGIASMIFKHDGKNDSVTYCCEKLLEYGNIYGKSYAHKELAEIAIKDNKLQNAFYHILLHDNFEDSIRKIKSSETIARMHAAYNYQMHERKAKELELSNERKRAALILAIAFIIVLSLILLLTIIIYKKRKKDHETKVALLQEVQESLVRFSQKYRDDMNDKIMNMKRQMEELQQKSDKRSEQEQEVIERLKAEKDELEFMLEKHLVTIRQKEKAQETIKETPIYQTFKKLANSQERIPTQKEWNELARVTNIYFPEFERKFKQMCRLNSQQYHACLLRKVGFGITETAELTCYEKVSVSTLYVRLYQKITGEKGTVKGFDSLLSTL